MNEDNSNNFAARVAALIAKAATADELQETVAKMGRIIESQNREAQWYMTRNAQLHDEIDKHLKRNAELSELCRERAKRIVALIRDTTALKRELEELHAKRGALLRVAGAQAVEIANLKVALEDANLPTPPCDDEWDVWSDKAIDALKQQLKDNEPSSNYS